MSSALVPAGVQAELIAWLWWIFVAVCTTVWVLVVAALAAAIWRGRRASLDAPPGVPHAGTDAGTHLTIGVATVATILTLFGLLAVTYATGRAMSSLDVTNAVELRIVGHQFWWEVHYEDTDPTRAVTTANEIHVPVGQPIALNLSSEDVIHSFWVPPLHGKIDLIPGHENHFAFRVDRPGIYEGQCAEFCGLQHAHMRIRVIAEPAEEFAAWLDAQRTPGKTPLDDAGWTGQHVLESRSCGLCHTVRGTNANGSVGPDLTHLASRTAIAAGALPNTSEHLQRWIVDPQGVKPGNTMPATALTPAELDALVGYLRSLS
jgi:cytochrome c oxidase subunit 2